MPHIGALVGAFAVLPVVHGIAFGAPAPTVTSPERALKGSSPKPTKAPSLLELRKRQRNAYPETCGWVDGDYSQAITCPVGTCILYTASSIGMAGCCESFDTQNCGWAIGCIDQEAYSSSSCDAACALNTFIRKCTASTAPYCVTWTYPSDGVADYGCSATSPRGIETILQAASDSVDSYTTSMSLPTATGGAVTGWDTTETTDSTDINPTKTFDGDVITSTDDLTTNPTSPALPSGSRKTRKKVSVGMIIGIVVAVLAVLALVISLVVFFCMKKKKQRQLAANQQAIAAAQANRPQSQYPPQQPPMQQAPPANFQSPPMPAQSPQPQYNGYFPPQAQNPDHKINSQAHVTEYGQAPPISNPTSPAPAYVQPYYANAPPMPSQSPVPAPAPAPAAGSHEVHGISAAQALGQPAPGPQAPAPQAQPVYEMGHGR